MTSSLFGPEDFCFHYENGRVTFTTDALDVKIASDSLVNFMWFEEDFTEVAPFIYETILPKDIATKHLKELGFRNDCYNR